MSYIWLGYMLHQYLTYAGQSLCTHMHEQWKYIVTKLPTPLVARLLPSIHRTNITIDRKSLDGCVVQGAFFTFWRCMYISQCFATWESWLYEEPPSIKASSSIVFKLAWLSL